MATFELTKVNIALTRKSNEKKDSSHINNNKSPKKDIAESNNSSSSNSKLVNNLISNDDKKESHLQPKKENEHHSQPQLKLKKPIIVSDYHDNLEKEQERKNKQKENQKNQESLKKEYLEFLIEKETNYANINEIENFYKNKLEEKKKKYNENILSLEQKEEEIKRLNLLISLELVKSYNNSDNFMITIVEKLMKKYKKLIKIQEHKFQTYQTMYNRQYHTRFMMRRRIENELEYDSKGEAQLRKYTILNCNSYHSIKRQSKLLDSMQKYNYKTLKDHAYEREIKAEEINNLELQIEIIKKSALNLEKEYNELKDKSKNINKSLLRFKKEYATNKSLHKQNFKEYAKQFIGYAKLLKLLNIHSSKELIKIYNVFKDDRQRLELSFNLMNSSIIKLSKTISQLDDQLISIKREIEHKNKNLNENGVKVDNSMERTKTIIRIINNVSNDIKNKTFLKLCFLQKVISFLVKSCKTFYSQISCKSPVIIPSIYKIISDKEEIIIPIEINKGIVILVLNIFIQFSNCIFHQTLKFMTYRISVFKGAGFPEKIIGLDSKEFKDNYMLNLKQLFEQIDLKKNELLTLKQNKLLLDKISKENKNRALNQAEVKGKEITQIGLFQKYLSYANTANKTKKENKNNSNSLWSINNNSPLTKKSDISTTFTNRFRETNNIQYFNDNYHKIKRLVNKYQNDLVYPDKKDNNFFHVRTTKATKRNTSMPLIFTSNKKQKESSNINKTSNQNTKIEQQTASTQNFSMESKAKELISPINKNMTHDTTVYSTHHKDYLNENTEIEEDDDEDKYLDEEARKLLYPSPTIKRLHFDNKKRRKRRYEMYGEVVLDKQKLDILKRQYDLQHLEYVYYNKPLKKHINSEEEDANYNEILYNHLRNVGYSSAKTLHVCSEKSLKNKILTKKNKVKKYQKELFDMTFGNIKKQDENKQQNKSEIINYFFARKNKDELDEFDETILAEDKKMKIFSKLNVEKLKTENEFKDSFDKRALSKTNSSVRNNSFTNKKNKRKRYNSIDMNNHESIASESKNLSNASSMYNTNKNFYPKISLYKKGKNEFFSSKFKK